MLGSGCHFNPKESNEKATLHTMHNTKFNALNEMQKNNPKLRQMKNKAILYIWKMHAFKLIISYRSSDLQENADVSVD